MRNKGIKYISIAGLFALLIMCWFFSCGWFGNGLKLIESTEFLMSTNVTAKVYVDSRADGEELLKKVFAEAKRIESIMQPREGDGELQRINNNTAGTRFELSPELKTVIDRAKYFYEQSGGAFDPTIASVKWLWEFDKDGRIPAKDEIDGALSTVNYSSVSLEGNTLKLGLKGTKLDLGGIAKGYIVDSLISLLKENGVKSGLINAGGDIYTFGKKSNGDDWIIGLRHPRMDKSYVLDHITLPAVATTGDYERYFMRNGVRYHHILDPSTGYPARRSVSVTVWTETAMDADALATTIFVLGPEEGVALAERLENVEALVFYDEDDELKYALSSGIEDIIKL